MSVGREHSAAATARPNRRRAGSPRTSGSARPKQWVKNVLVDRRARRGRRARRAHRAVPHVHCVRVLLPRRERHVLHQRRARRRRRPPPPDEALPSRSRRARSRCAARSPCGIGLLVASIGLSFVARWQLALVIGGYLVLTVALQPVAEARSRARPRVRRVGIRAAHDRGRRRGPGRRSRRGSSSSRVRRRCSWSPASATPSSSSWATARSGTAASLEMYSTVVPQLRARGRVERHDPRVLPVGVREVVGVGSASPHGDGRNAVWFQLSIIPFVLGILRYALLRRDRAAAAHPKSSCSPIACCSILGALWAVLFAIAVRARDRGRRTAPHRLGPHRGHPRNGAPRRVGSTTSSLGSARRIRAG